MMLSETNRDGNPDGADLFFPSTVYALMQLEKYQVENCEAQKMLKSNLVYIRMFRTESLLHGQDDYYLQTFESAAEFILAMNKQWKTDLKVEQIGEVEAFKQMQERANKLEKQEKAKDDDNKSDSLDQWAWSNFDDQEKLPQESVKEEEKKETKRETPSLDDMLSGESTTQQKFQQSTSH